VLALCFSRTKLLSAFLLLSILPQQSRAQDNSLDPLNGKYFVLSTVFDLLSLPRPQDRIQILSKLATFGRASVGYGLSLRGFKTSIRPQLYWSAGEGDGGFFTFGDYNFKPRHRYALTLVSRPGEFVALYLQERSKTVTDKEPLGSPTGPVVFLGGHDFKGVVTPKNNSVLSYKSPDEADRSEHVSLLAAFIAQPEKLKDSVEKLLQFLDGAPENLATSFKGSEIRLWEFSSVPKEETK